VIVAEGAFSWEAPSLEDEFMKGVQYLFDDKGKAKAVLIDLEKHRDIWEDFQDLVVAEKRRKEPRESLEEVEARLRRLRKLK
jgi:hypothetical protein